jgi:hypothetical protein
VGIGEAVLELYIWIKRRLAERQCHHVYSGRRDVLGVIDRLRQATGITLGLGYGDAGVVLEEGVEMALTQPLLICSNRPSHSRMAIHVDVK